MNKCLRIAVAGLAVVMAGNLALPAQVSSSAPSSSTSDQSSPVAGHRGVEAAGSAVTLETNEALFTIAATLNACGYDSGLANSLPVRAQIRQEIADAVNAGGEAASAKTAVCGYISGHHLEGSQNLAQYVSLALFVSPPPQLALTFPENQMPPDALNVVNILPLLRTFNQAVGLHRLWLRHRADYDAAMAQVHGTITRMLLETNVYLHQPVSSYDGRRFLVLLEPMLAPEAVNARIYGNDYFVATSLQPALPSAEKATSQSTRAISVIADGNAHGIHLEDIRHIYLLYEIDPIIYARASSTSRLLPILKAIQDAPIDFLYKNDIVAFTTECLIKAIEARTMDTGIEKPVRKVNGKERFDPEGYNTAVAEWERKSEEVRRRQVVADMRSGWVLTGYFYDKLSLSDREGISLKENMGELVYGMDVPSETSRAKKVPFFPEGSPELVGTSGRAGRTLRERAPRRNLTAMDQAEMLLQKGDREAAGELAGKELAAHPNSGEALYVLARVNLMDGDPQQAFDRFTQVVATSKDPRTLAWSHVYLGRMYDTLAEPDRTKAVAEYKAALGIPGIQPDVRLAAESGVKKPFAAPRRAPQEPVEDEEELDPTGKKQKESYKPSEEVPPPPAAAQPK